MSDISLSRSESITILGALDDGRQYAFDTDAFALVIEMEDATDILDRRMYPGLDD